MRSVAALVAGFLLVAVATTLVDAALRAAGVYPPFGLDDAQCALATAYRVVIGVAAAWLTARLAPRAPMRHALVLGGIGTALAFTGLVLTWNAGLGPRWYPMALVALALPQSWLGGWIFEHLTHRQSADPAA